MMKPLTKPAAPAAAQTIDQPAAPLDPVIAATANRRKSITGKTAAFLGVEPEAVFDVLRGIWSVTKGEPPLSTHELMVGMALVSRYELDPFAREVYVTRNKGRLMTILGVDAWIKILNRTDHYDGFTQELHEAEDGSLEWVETAIYSKHRKHPAKYRAYAREYAKLGGFVAKTIPDHMLRLFSLRHAARLFIPLGGCVTEEEARWMGGAAADSSAPPVSSLDELADRLEGKEVEAEVEPEPAESPHPELLDAYATEFGHAQSVDRVEQLWEAVLVDMVAGGLTPPDKAALAELANAAKERIGKKK